MTSFFKHSTPTLALAVACALSIAPAAMAQGAGDAGTTQSRAGGQQSAMRPMITKNGQTTAYLLHHGYIEALHAQQSLGLHMNDMAANHLENVRLMLADIDLNRDIMDSTMRNKVKTLRDQVGRAGSSPDVQGASQIVGQFATIFQSMPTAMGGGGGGGLPLTPMMHLPVELVGMAQESAANLQADAAMRDFKGASLHGQHIIAVLDEAVLAGKRQQLGASAMRDLQAIQGRARDLLSLVGQRSPQTVVASGQLVTMIGGYLPALVPTGGGAGTGGSMQNQNQNE